MPAKKKKTKEEEEVKKPKKKRATTRKTTAAKKTKKPAKKKVEKKPEVEEVQEIEEIPEVEEEAVEEEKEIGSSVPKDYFNKSAAAVSIEDEVEEKEEPQEEVSVPEEEAEETVKEEATIKDKIEEHVEDGGDVPEETSAFYIEDLGDEEEEDADTQPVKEIKGEPQQEREEAPLERPRSDFHARSTTSSWLPMLFYILTGIAVIALIYLVLAYFVFSTDLSYEFTGKRTPVVTEEVLEEPEERDQVEILSTPTGYLRVRSGPATSYDEIVKAFPGDVYPLLGTDGDWIEIELEEGVSGWVFAEYAETLSE